MEGRGHYVGHVEDDKCARRTLPFEVVYGILRTCCGIGSFFSFSFLAQIILSFSLLYLVTVKVRRLADGEHSRGNGRTKLEAETTNVQPV